MLMAAGGIWVRDIPTPRPLFPYSRVCRDRYN